MPQAWRPSSNDEHEKLPPSLRKKKYARKEGTRKRAEPESLWVDTPLNLYLRSELDARGWIISDLARAIGSQTSLVSRWMQGQRPNTESLQLVAEALGLDVLHLLTLAGHLKPRDEDNVDPRLRKLIAKLRQVTMSDERYQMLDATLEMMRRKPPTATVPGATNGDRPPVEGSRRASA